MRTLIGMFWLLVFTSTLQAQVSKIRGGDHDTFTRLTIENPLNSEWTVIQNEGRIEVRFERSLKFDTDNVFSRIKKDRVSKVVQLEKSLEIWLSCKCRSDYFQSGGGLIVIDISSENERNSQSIYSESSWISQKLAPMKDQVKAPRPRIGPKVESVELRPSPLSKNPVGARSLNSLTERLPRQFSKASTTGILNPNFELAPRREQKDSLRSSIETNSSKPKSNLRLLTNTIDDEELYLPEEIREVAAHCKTIKIAPMHNWASSTNFSHQVSLARNEQLRNEDGSMPDEYLRRLSRTYAYFGLMQEAESYISKDLSRTARVMKIIYKVVSNKNIVDGEILQKMHDCGGELKFWANFAKNTSAIGTLDDIDELIHHFDKLPNAIKILIAPRVVRLLNSQGWIDQRDYVKRLLALANESANSKGATAAPNVQESVLLDRDYRTRMVQNILGKDPENFTLDPSDFQILESYLFELRGVMPDFEREIINSYILAFSGQHVPALRLASECRVGNSLRDCSVVRNDIRLNFVKTVGDENFLLNLFQYPNLVFPEQSGTLRDHFEDRLKGFGLLEYFLKANQLRLHAGDIDVSSTLSLFEGDDTVRNTESEVDLGDVSDIGTDLRHDPSLGDFRRMLRDGQESRVKWEGKFDSVFQGG